MWDSVPRPCASNRVFAMKKTRASTGTIFFLSAIYFVSYLTRNSYNVAIAGLLRETGFSQATLALCVTGSLTAYGLGQLASGLSGDRTQPRLLILSGLGVTSGMNLLMAFCRVPALMLAIWCVNGLAQAFLWPPLVRLMAELFSGELYQRAVVAVTWGGSVGNIVLYLMAPLLISAWGVESVFLFAALCGLAMFLAAAAKCPRISPKPAGGREGPPETGTSLFRLPLMWMILLVIVLQGLLRDGITTWTPVYTDAVYHLGSSFSILSSTALPIFSIFSIQAASLLHSKLLRNPLACAGSLFGLGGLFGFLMAAFPSLGAAWSVGLCALLIGCMHGVNLILIGVLPAHFQRFGKVSLFSGVLNAFTYVGSALSAYGFAAAADHAGWQAVTASWPVISLLGMLVCFLCAKPWLRFQER